MTQQELINNISKSNYLTHMYSLRQRLRERAYDLMEKQHDYVNYLQSIKQGLIKQYQETGTWSKLEIYKHNICYYNAQKKKVYLTPFSKLPKYVTYKKAFGYAVCLYYADLELHVELKLNRELRNRIV